MDNELKLAEQLRISSLLELSEYKQAIYNQPALLACHFNRFEWGLEEEPIQQEADVYCYAAKALLSNVVEQVMLLRGNDIMNNHDFWLDGTRAYFQTAENILSRFLTYHQELKEYKEQSQRHSKTIHLLYQVENEILHALLNETNIAIENQNAETNQKQLLVSELFAAYATEYLEKVEIAYRSIFAGCRNILNLENQRGEKTKLYFLQQYLRALQGAKERFDTVWRNNQGVNQRLETQHSIEKQLEHTVEEEKNTRAIEEQIRLTQERLFSSEIVDVQQDATKPIPLNILELEKQYLTDNRVLKESKIKDLTTAETTVVIKNSEITESHMKEWINNESILKQLFNIEKNEAAQSHVVRQFVENTLVRASAPYYKTIQALQLIVTNIQNNGMDMTQNVVYPIEKMIANHMLSVKSRLAILEQYSQMLYRQYAHINNNQFAPKSYASQSDFQWNTNSQNGETVINTIQNAHEQNIALFHPKNQEENRLEMVDNDWMEQTKIQEDTSINIEKRSDYEYIEQSVRQIHQGYEILKKQLSQINQYHSQTDYSAIDQFTHNHQNFTQQTVNRQYTELQNIEGSSDSREQMGYYEKQTATLQERLQEINRKNNIMRQKIIEAQQKKIVAKNVLPDRTKTIQQAQRALENPAAALSKIISQNVETEQQENYPTAVETIIESMDSTSQKIYKELLQYELNPEKVLEGGVIRPGNQAMLTQELRNIERQNQTLFQKSAVEQNAETHFHEKTESLLGTLQGQGRETPSIPSVYSIKPAMVHKPLESQLLRENITEYFANQSQNKSQAQHQQVMTETVIKQTVESEELNKKLEEKVSKNAEDVNRIIEQTLARQMNTITEKVYTHMERRLVIEQARRGRF